MKRTLILLWTLLAAAVVGLVTTIAVQGVDDVRRFRSIAQEVDERTPIVMYATLQSFQLDAVEQAFEAANPSYDLVVYRASSGKLHTRLAADQQSGSSKADVVWMNNPSSFRSFLRDDLLETYRSPNAGPPLEKLGLDPQRVTVVMSNPTVFFCDAASGIELPSTWEELLQMPQFVFPDPELSGAMLHVLQVLDMHPDYGDAYLQRLAQSGAQVSGGSGPTAYRVAHGESPIGILPRDVALMTSHMGVDVRMAVPTDVPVEVPSPIALLHGAPNPEGGKRFIDWILSGEGQQVLAGFGCTPASGIDSSLLVDEGSLSSRRSLLRQFNELFVRR